MTEQAIFAAGCFWGVEAAFRALGGVKETAVGYIGGTTQAPTYEQVCQGNTGHAEAVRVDYDPQTISYEELLSVFWACHNPTQVNRQGPDFGTQYRTEIFTLSDAQKEAALASREAEEGSGRHGSPIATQITPASEFYLAEDYHQHYLEKRGMVKCH